MLRQQTWSRVLCAASAHVLLFAVAVAQQNTPPAVQITSPLDGQTVSAGDQVSFAGTATDAEDGDLSQSLIWTSSLEGMLGHGPSFSRVLRTGTHDIVATATDTGGRVGAARIRITIAPPSLVFAATADTYLTPRRPHAACGTKRYLLAGGTAARSALLRFEVSGLPQGPIKKAVIRLTVGAGQHAGSRHGGTLQLLTAPIWAEATTTYSTRPPLGDRVIATLGMVTPRQTVEIDVTDVVTAPGTYDFALVSRSHDAVRYRSREAPSGQPVLVMVFDDPSRGGDPDDGGPQGGDPGGGGDDGVGYEDFAFGPGVETVENKATAQKPESKLWYHDGIWWATLYGADIRAHHIHRLDMATQVWVDTGVAVDERARSRQDVLWTGETLYMVSRYDGAPAEARLLRYHYVAEAQAWTLDPGFPVPISGGGTESMTIAKDSSGALWIAYTLNGQVWANQSLGDDATWGDPFVVPVAEGTSVSLDDIAGVQVLPGAMGVFWSNQITEKFYFAVHADGTLGSVPLGWTLETAAEGSKIADDHFNMKLGNDGRLFVAVKTSRRGATDTLVGLLVRAPDGGWSRLHPVTTVEFNPTRPLCLLDEVARLVHVFYSPNQTNVYYKSSNLDSISFPGGSGAPFITSARVGGINNPTSTKQSVSAPTGLVVVAATSETKTYWHNAISPRAPTPPPDESTPAPALARDTGSLLGGP